MDHRRWGSEECSILTTRLTHFWELWTCSLRSDIEGIEWTQNARIGSSARSPWWARNVERPECTRPSTTSLLSKSPNVIIARNFYIEIHLICIQLLSRSTISLSQKIAQSWINKIFLFSPFVAEPPATKRKRADWVKFLQQSSDKIAMCLNARKCNKNSTERNA